MKYLLLLTLVLIASVSYCQPVKRTTARSADSLIVKNDTIHVTSDTSKVIMVLLKKGEGGNDNYIGWEEGVMIRRLENGKPVTARYFKANLSREFDRKEIFDARLPEQ